MARKKKPEPLKVNGTETVDELREKFAKIALELAEEHDWCDVVEETLTKRLGLGEFVPDRWIVQIKKSARGDWKQDDYNSESYTNADLTYAIEDAELAYRSARTAPRARDSISTHVIVDADPNAFEETVTALRKMHDVLVVEKAARDKALAKQPEYPQYRVVSEKTGEVKHVAGMGL